MPELPDVEVYRRRVDPAGLERMIASVSFGDTDLRRGIPESALRKRLPGRALTVSQRHGKFLFLRIGDDGWLVLHFGMTGEVHLLNPDDPPPQHTRMTVRFEDGGALAYTNMRKLGRVDCVESVEDVIAEEHLGPDPLEDGVDATALEQALEGRRGTLKAALTNQQVIAGIGNIYADEILLEAGLNPRLQVQNLSEDDVDRIATAMRVVLDEAIEAEVSPDRFPWRFILPDRHDRALCPRCGHPLVRTKISGRTTYFCPEHQPDPTG